MFYIFCILKALFIASSPIVHRFPICSHMSFTSAKALQNYARTPATYDVNRWTVTKICFGSGLAVATPTFSV